MRATGTADVSITGMGGQRPVFSQGDALLQSETKNRSLDRCGFSYGHLYVNVLGEVPGCLLLKR